MLYMSILTNKGLSLSSQLPSPPWQPRSRGSRLCPLWATLSTGKEHLGCKLQYSLSNNLNEDSWCQWYFSGQVKNIQDTELRLVSCSFPFFYGFPSHPPILLKAVLPISFMPCPLVQPPVNIPIIAKATHIPGCKKKNAIASVGKGAVETLFDDHRQFVALPHTSLQTLCCLQEALHFQQSAEQVISKHLLSLSTEISVKAKQKETALIHPGCYRVQKCTQAPMGCKNDYGSSKGIFSSYL